MIAVDQDPAGIQGTLLSTSGNGQVWVKPLSDGSPRRRAAEPRLERHLHHHQRYAVGLPSASSYTLRNLWTHNTSSTGGTISAEVPGGSTVLLRVAPR